MCLICEEKNKRIEDLKKEVEVLRNQIISINSSWRDSYSLYRKEPDKQVKGNNPYMRICR